MMSDDLKGRWLELRGKIKQRWAKLTDDDLKHVEGSWDLLMGKLISTYGYTRDAAEGQIKEFKTELTQFLQKGLDKTRNVVEEVSDNLKRRTSITPGGERMNAITLLENDHQHLNRLFEEIQLTADVPRRAALFLEIEHALETHTEIEEKVFYPMAEKEAQFKDMIGDYRKEHDQVKQLLQQIRPQFEVADETKAMDREEKIQELIDRVKKHVNEEEQELFPQVRASFAVSDLERAGAEMEEIKSKRSQKQVAA